MKRNQLAVAIYARVSTGEQQSLSQQIRSLRKYAKDRGWSVAAEVRDVGSGASVRPQREEIMRLARQHAIDVVLVWKLDRWGRSLADLAVSLADLQALGVSFVSFTEAVDLTTPTGRAMAGLLSVFAEFERDLLRERVRMGIDRAREEGKLLGRPRTARSQTKQVQQMIAAGASQAAIARQLNISRTSVRRILRSETAAKAIA